MAYSGTTPGKKSHDHDVGEKAKSHAARLSETFRQVKEKLGLRKMAGHRPGILPRFVETSDRDESREGKCNIQIVAISFRGAIAFKPLDF